MVIIVLYVWAKSSHVGVYVNINVHLLLRIPNNI